jgi:predicted short-subunit dehydrogenase-like oxidoreductase (DUF2520 family)
MKISFIGAGNVAWNLAPALENAGNSVQEVFSRNPAKAKDLVSYLYNAQVQEHLDFSESSATVFFVCIPEATYAQVLPELLLPKYATLVLVSTSFPLVEAATLYDPNRESTNQIGVFYPLQFFKKEKKVNLTKMPICLESHSEETQGILIQLAKDITDLMYTVNSEERKKIHLASLMAGLFTRQLLDQAKELLHDIELDANLIQPLVNNQIQAYFAGQKTDKDSEQAQLPNTRQTFDHLDMIKTDEMQEVYKNLIKSIKRK